ncbi:MAG: hypothetical protein P8M10_02840 [Ilumatobacter sp.]|nr:hypothetical protein [Ilumatobacter sp.]
MFAQTLNRNMSSSRARELHDKTSASRGVSTCDDSTIYGGHNAKVDGGTLRRKARKADV